MSSPIAQLKSASVVTQSLVRQAMLEAKTDPSKMSALQEAFDGKAESQFEKVDQFDQMQQFIQDWACDKFELRPNTTNRVPQRATITEARITKVDDVVREVINRPPAPPVNPGRYRDPLHITGVAEPGAKVEVYNASVPGRPVIDTVTADATGKFRVELTDESKFSFGDQMGIVVVDGGGSKSRPVIVPTEPFQVTNTTTNFRDRTGGAITRTDVTSNMRAMPANHDVRAPFYQAGKVTTDNVEPKSAGEAWSMTLKGKDDAVEPNSTVSVKVGSETFETKVADDGTFALKLSGFLPGDVLKVQVRDINGQGIDHQVQVPHVRNEEARIAAGMFIAPTLTAPTGGRETVGTEPPWVAFKASEVTVPHGAVVIKNKTTGEISELTADAKGSINGAVGGVSEFDVLQIATRDANGNFSEKTTDMVVMPDKSYGDFLVPTEGLTGAKGPALEKILEAIEGPPNDLFVKRGGKEIKDPRGPFLAMPAVKGLPPHGQLAVVRDGEVVQTLRADDKGVVKGYLRGVSVGDRLDFRVLDAAGRRFPQEVVGFEVPGAGKKTKLTKDNLHTPSDARSLADCIDMVGTGKLDVEHAWVQPFTVGAQANPPAPNDFKLHYSPLVFAGRPAADIPVGQPQQVIEQLPTALATKFGVGTAISLSLQESNGTQALSITDGQQRITVGIDYVVGAVNAGSFSQPLTQAHLPQLGLALKMSLALVAAAYDQGKEPGDLVYDRAMSSAKTVLYALDKFSEANPTLAAEAKAAAVDAMPKDFPFELFGTDRVPPDSQQRPLAEVTAGKRTSTMSLIEARAAAMGRVDSPPVSTSGLNAPRVDVAAIMKGGQNNSRTAAMVRGRGNPGDVIQVFNMSAGPGVLLGETLVQPNGKYELIGSGSVAYGDQLGVMGVSRDGKTKSRLNVVPTDAYAYNGADVRTAVPVRHPTDDRPPLIRPSSFKMSNASFDKDGAVRDGSPYWSLTSEDFGVEPNSTVSIRGEKPDGSHVTVTARADDQGRFSMEFPFPALRPVRINVTDVNGTGAKVVINTPGLTDINEIRGDRAADAASGVVTLRLADADVRGVVVEHSVYGSGKDITISDADRSDGFVDVVVRQTFSVQYANGVNDQNATFRIKVAPDEAKKLAAGINDEFTLEGALLDALNFDRGDNDPARAFVSAQTKGQARIIDRDYLLKLDN